MTAPPPSDPHPGDDPEERDPGLARERTSLAWTRTAIAFAALGGTMLKANVVTGLIILAVTLVIWQLGRVSRSRLPAGGLPADPAGSGPLADPAGSGPLADPAGSGPLADPAGCGLLADPAGSGPSADPTRPPQPAAPGLPAVGAVRLFLITVAVVAVSLLCLIVAIFGRSVPGALR